MIPRSLAIRLRSLGPEDRAEAVRALTETPEPAAARFAELRAAVEAATGEPLRLKGRDGTAAWRRGVIAWKMACEGYTEMAIGRQIGRDHSTVHYLKKQVAQALDRPKMYPEIHGLVGAINQTELKRNESF